MLELAIPIIILLILAPFIIGAVILGLRNKAAWNKK
jgi:hypothetical protein